MPRPHCCRLIRSEPEVTVFKPAGVPARDLEVVTMTLDEFEAVRLADLDGLYQEQAAERMGVSRATFGRIVESARRKVAEALVRGMVLKIEGGPVQVARRSRRLCPSCNQEWPSRRGAVATCPRCRSADR
jgi:predicted DNA-binding protein (UPF0251 family)